MVFKYICIYIYVQIHPKPLRWHRYDAFATPWQLAFGELALAEADHGIKWKVWLSVFAKMMHAKCSKMFPQHVRYGSLQLFWKICNIHQYTAFSAHSQHLVCSHGFTETLQRWWPGCCPCCLLRHCIRKYETFCHFALSIMLTLSNMTQALHQGPFSVEPVTLDERYWTITIFLTFFFTTFSVGGVPA